MRAAPSPKSANGQTQETVSGKADPAEIRYGGAVDVKRASDLYAQGWTLRQIGAELGVSRSTVSEQLRQAGVTMRRGGPPAHPASTLVHSTGTTPQPNVGWQGKQGSFA
jgi:AraC-like DNA-binding protein